MKCSNIYGRGGIKRTVSAHPGGASSFDCCQPLLPPWAGWHPAPSTGQWRGPALRRWAWTCILIGLVQGLWPPRSPHTAQATPGELGPDLHGHRLRPGQPAPTRWGHDSRAGQTPNAPGLPFRDNCYTQKAVTVLTPPPLPASLEAICVNCVKRS